MTFIWEKQFHGLLLCLLTAASLPAAAQEHSLTARQIVERIQQHVGVPWRGQTVDTFKAGDPDTPVQGIAVTMMATFDVLRRAAEAGDNFIVTHEPTFYNHLDTTADFEREHDAVFAAKQTFINRHGLVVWRFHDHWHARRPDGIQTGMIHALGWEKFQNSENNRLFILPETTVGHLAASIQQTLGIRTLRVVGNPDMKVTKIALNPGYPGFPTERHTLQR
ncbi:MAG: Nif3-like dinuclear metal center hexameric protein, partial [Bryobacteraceae bacterium]